MQREKSDCEIFFLGGVGVGGGRQMNEDDYNETLIEGEGVGGVGEEGAITLGPSWE